jgi:23S rRNA pseudouridine1911/1915/1917 synthase
MKTIIKTCDYTVPEEYANERIDIFLVSAIEDNFSRTYIQKLIKDNRVTVNGKIVKSNHKLKSGELIVLNIPSPEILDMQPENIPLEIIFQDKSIAVINKQYGLAVHPGAGLSSGTLVNALLYHIKDLSSIGGVERPGIVHRLDRDTAGLMVIAKNDVSHRNLVEQFSERHIYKEYMAIVRGKPNEEKGSIKTFIDRHPIYRHKMTVSPKGKFAHTDYEVVKTFLTRDGAYSLVKIIIHTGRTHQIRVHFSSIGNPVIGDPIYSKPHLKYKDLKLMLASVTLKFEHPENKKELSFSTELPPHMKAFINQLEKDGE